MLPQKTYEASLTVVTGGDTPRQAAQAMATALAEGLTAEVEFTYRVRSMQDGSESEVQAIGDDTALHMADPSRYFTFGVIVGMIVMGLMAMLMYGL